MWITCNKNNQIYLWQIKPKRGNEHWHSEYESLDSYYSMLLDEDSDTYKMYSYLTWKDEPIKVELKRVISAEEALNEFDLV